MIPALAPLACALGRRTQGAGAEWWLFHADSTVVPIRPNVRANLAGPGPFCSSPGALAAWCVNVSAQNSIGLLLNCTRTRRCARDAVSSRASRPAPYAARRRGCDSKHATAPVRRREPTAASHCRLPLLDGPAGFLVVGMGLPPAGLSSSSAPLILRACVCIGSAGLVPRMDLLQIGLASWRPLPAVAGWTTFRLTAAGWLEWTDLTLVPNLPAFDDAPPLPHQWHEPSRLRSQRLGDGPSACRRVDAGSYCRTP